MTLSLYLFNYLKDLLQIHDKQYAYNNNTWILCWIIDKHVQYLPLILFAVAYVVWEKNVYDLYKATRQA